MRPHSPLLCLQKIFRTTMLFQFVNVLLQVLVHKSHDLLQEEIGIAIYNMASVDFDGFFAAFLPEFLTSCDGVDANQKNVLGRNFKMDRVRKEKVQAKKEGKCGPSSVAPDQWGSDRLGQCRSSGRGSAWAAGAVTGAGARFPALASVSPCP